MRKAAGPGRPKGARSPARRAAPGAGSAGARPPDRTHPGPRADRPPRRSRPRRADGNPPAAPPVRGGGTGHDRDRRPLRPPHRAGEGRAGSGRPPAPRPAIRTERSAERRSGPPRSGDGRKRRSGPSGDPKQLLRARQAAAAILTSVLFRNVALQAAIAASPLLPGLDDRDRAFARALVTATLRRRGQIDAAIGSFLERPLPPHARHAWLMLLMGAAQILFLRVPAYAAVSTSMELLIRGPGRTWRGLVNAVLRGMADRGAGIVRNQDAGRLNTPDWLWRSWIGAYGTDTAARIAAAHLNEPALDLCPKTDPEAWATRLGGTVVLDRAVRVAAGGSVDTRPGFREGAWWVQDAAAQLPVRLLGRIAGSTVADLCAAPGGKTLQMAALGARVTALDVSESRIRRLSANLARTRLEAETVVADATDWDPGCGFDAVLVDAPCTATGTIRRRPDVPWQRTASDFRALAALQDRLLDRALGLVRPGGLVVYTVCSLQPEECEHRVQAFLARHPEAGLVAVRAGADAVPDPFVTASGYLRTLPCHLAEAGGVDGFFAARIRRPELGVELGDRL